MDLRTAVSLIKKGVAPGNAQRWADLGAGEGTFTNALATLLAKGSTIHAVDKNETALGKIPAVEGVEIKKVVGDFERAADTLSGLDGFLMANALHYVKAQEQFIERLRPCLRPGGTLLIVEYDTDIANTWIPYPVSYLTLCDKARKTNFSVTLIGRTSSQYQRAGMYAAVLK